MSDSRFSTLASDPRYRLPSRKESRTTVDPRFKGLFADQEFRKKASVDRYGRKIKPDLQNSDVERSYRLEKKPPQKKQKPGKIAVREVVGSSDEDEFTEEDENSEEQLVEKRDLAREGFSGSSSSEESSEEDESDSEAELAEETAGQEQDEEIPMGEVARRIAVVNLDWDNIRAVDIMSVASSFVPTGGKISGVTIYPSEFGRERLEREEIEGPPREIFASSKQKAVEEEDEESSEDDEAIKKRLLEGQANDGEEFDTAKLRQYQLERLRYYYAVIECDTLPTAKALYDAMDGREYLTTSNFFDLRFIPDDTSFDDDEPFDECDGIPQGYKPNDFRTEALTHSKVRLTWDDDDRTRKEIQKRAFTRAEIDENDLQAYIGTDDSDADSVASRMSVAEKRKAAKKAEKKDKMRSALGLGAEPTKTLKLDKDEPVGDMQITFTSGIGGEVDGKGVFENEPQDEESTRARYIRKERERKQRRKENMKAARKAEKEGKLEETQSASAGAQDGEEADPFNDPFFTDPAAAAKAEKQARLADKLKKQKAREAQDEEAQGRRAELELLMADDQGGDVRHFDMREIEKARKAEKRKGKKGSKKNATAERVQDDFKIETQDPRLKALFESHEYAIDPTNPEFKNTDGMKALLEAGRKKRKHVEDAGDETAEREKTKKSKAEPRQDLEGLVARLKKKGAR